jgi:glutamate--cysteine ligase catalytic subunit
MQTCQKRDAAIQTRFHFRASINNNKTSAGGNDTPMTSRSLHEIFNGYPGFPGLVPLVEDYISTRSSLAPAAREQFHGYLRLIRRRASGECMTAARWLRRFVLQHPAYEHDSKLHDSTIYDLCKTVQRITSGTLVPSELFGSSDSTQ